MYIRIFLHRFASLYIDFLRMVGKSRGMHSSQAVGDVFHRSLGEFVMQWSQFLKDLFDAFAVYLLRVSAGISISRDIDKIVITVKLLTLC